MKKYVFFSGSFQTFYRKMCGKNVENVLKYSKSRHEGRKPSNLVTCHLSLLRLLPMDPSFKDMPSITYGCQNEENIKS